MILNDYSRESRVSIDSEILKTGFSILVERTAKDYSSDKFAKLENGYSIDFMELEKD